MKAKKDLLSRYSKSLNFFQLAAKSSLQDIQFRTNAFLNKPSKRDALLLARSLFNSGTFFANSFVQSARVTIGAGRDADHEKNLGIVKQISEDQMLSENYSDQEAFQAILSYLTAQFYRKSSPRKMPHPSSHFTIVLIPGVLNEIFTTPAFERGCQHLKKKYGYEYLNIPVRGTAAIQENVEIIKKTLFERSHARPDEKYFFVCFSKGGVDALHFLVEEKRWAEENIIGITTIASPINGSGIVEHKIIELLSLSEPYLSRVPKGNPFAHLKGLIKEEFLHSLRCENQHSWLIANTQNLPKNVFLSSIALSSGWINSHVWMMILKTIFPKMEDNDGLITISEAQFPADIDGAIHIASIEGHHLIGSRSSYYCQEALLESILIFLHLKKLL